MHHCHQSAHSPFSRTTHAAVIPFRWKLLWCSLYRCHCASSPFAYPPPGSSHSNRESVQFYSARLTTPRTSSWQRKTTQSILSLYSKSSMCLHHQQARSSKPVATVSIPNLLFIIGKMVATSRTTTFQRHLILPDESTRTP